MRVTFDFNMCRSLRFGLTALMFAFSVLVFADDEPLQRIPPTADELAKLSKRLLSDIEYLSPYWASKSLPPIALVTQEEINRVVCKKPCAVRAAYIPDRGVLLAESLDPINTPLDRSILLHELVHYLQEINGRFTELTPCKRWFQREHEAYAVQNQYLYKINANRHVGGMLEPSMCKDFPEEKTSNTFQTEAERSNLRY
jgi:hypothetical protein